MCLHYVHRGCHFNPDSTFCNKNYFTHIRYKRDKSILYWTDIFDVISDFIEEDKLSKDCTNQKNDINDLVQNLIKVNLECWKSMTVNDKESL